MKTIDAMIIGGGPAGGATACLMSRSGLSTVLVEAQASFTQRVCGAYLCPAGVALLDRLGGFGSLTAECRRLDGMRLFPPSDRTLQLDFPSSSGIPPHGVALRRPEFDRQLLELAGKSGATIRMGTRVTGITHVDNYWIAALSTGEEISARILVGADGRRSWTARRLGLSRPAPSKRVALHLDVDALIPTDPFGEMHVFNDGNYIGIDPLDSTTLNVSLVCDPEDLRHADPAALLNRYISDSEDLHRRIAPITPARETGITFPASAACASPIGHRSALVGDASGFIDPLTGEGIYMALWSAAELADRVAEACRNERTLDEALLAYARERIRRHRAKRAACLAFQKIIRHPMLCEFVFDALSFRRTIGDAFIGVVGNIYSPRQAAVRLLKGLTHFN